VAEARGQGRIALGDIVITEFGISVRHLDRPLDGLVLATSSRVEWPSSSKERSRSTPSAARTALAVTHSARLKQSESGPGRVSLPRRTAQSG
jgi:hypothetical protein